MKNKILSAVIMLTLATSVSACQSTGVTPQQQAQVGGALLGGLLGYGLGKGHSNKGASILGGLALGAIAGDFIGQKLSATSQQAHTKTVAHTLEYSPTGTANSWNNPDAYQSEQGRVQVTKSYQQPRQMGQYEGRYCREFIQEIRVGNQVQQGYGTACRQPDGSWEMLK
jgi:surface antigen